MFVTAEDLLREELYGKYRAVVLLRRKLRLGPFFVFVRFINETNATVFETLLGKYDIGNADHYRIYLL